MKKYLILLLSLVLLIPTVVRADAITISYHHNRKVVTGGYLELTITPGNEDRTINEMAISYDTNMLSISKSDITVSVCGMEVLGNPEAPKDGLTVGISNGKISIKADKPIGYPTCLGGPQNVVIGLTFKALKAGKADVTIDAKNYFCNGGSCEDIVIPVNVKDPDFKCPEPTNCVTAAEEPQEPTEEPTEKPEEVKPVTNEEKKEEVKQDNTLLYISLGANVVLLLGLILALVLKKKPEPVPAPVVVPEPTPEPTPAPTPEPVQPEEPVQENTDTNNE